MLGHLWKQSKCLSCLFDVTQTFGACWDGILSFCLKLVYFLVFWFRFFCSFILFCFNLEDNTYEILTGIEGECHPPSPSFAPASKSSPQRSCYWVCSKLFPCVVIHVYLFLIQVDSYYMFGLFFVFGLFFKHFRKPDKNAWTVPPF